MQYADKNNDKQYLTKAKQRRYKKRLMLLLLLLLLPLLGTGFWVGSLVSNYFSHNYSIPLRAYQTQPLVALHSAIKPLALPVLKVKKQHRFAPFIFPASKISGVSKVDTSTSKKHSVNTKTKASSLASANYIPFSEKVPAGFEYLSEPVDTIVDVFYAGRFVESVSATYTPTTIRFHNPKIFLDKIKNIKNRVQVEKALTGKLANNSHLVCPGQPNPSCGELKPNVAGVIFDANKFKATVFINQDYLTAAPAPNPFLPSSNAGFSFVSHLYGVTNGISDDAADANKNSYGFRAVNDIGYKATMLHSELSYSQDDSTNNDGNISNFHVDQLDMGHYFDSKYLVRGGILDSVGNTFVGNQSYAGISFQTTLDTLQEDGTVFGSRLQVFLSTPSYVSIYRDGRLLASKYYQAGNQTLDTSSLPNGAYQVTLRIRDSQGQTTEETRFFSKTSQIPPMAFPQYNISLGYIEKNQFDQTTAFPEFGNTAIYQVGYNKRIQPDWGVSTSLVGTEHVSLASAGVFLLGKGYQINPQVLYGTDKEEGVGLNLQTTIHNFNASLFGRQIWARNKPQINTVLSDVDPLDIPIENFLTAQQDSTQADLSFGYNFKHVYTAFNAHVSKFANLPVVYSFGPDVRFPIFHENGTNIDMHISSARSRNDWQVLAQLVVYFTSPNWVNSANVGYQSINDRTGNNAAIEQNSGAVANVNSYWQHLNAAQEGAILGVNANTEPGRNSIGGNAEYTAPLGGLQANLQHNMGSETARNTQYSANFDTHVAYADNHTAVGGTRAADNTGIIVDIESPTPGDEFQVLVNDQVMQIVKTDHPTPVFLTPFKTYHIRVKSVSQHFYEYSATPRTITLYKGNFKTLTWKTKQKVIVFGYLKSPDGKPLRNTIIRGGIGINVTDEDGSAQIELYDDVKQLTAHLPDNRACVITLPALKKDGSLTLAKKLICRPTTREQHHEKKSINHH